LLAPGSVSVAQDLSQSPPKDGSGKVGESQAMSP